MLKHSAREMATPPFPQYPNLDQCKGVSRNKRVQHLSSSHAFEQLCGPGFHVDFPCRVKTSQVKNMNVFLRGWHLPKVQENHPQRNRDTCDKLLIQIYPQLYGHGPPMIHPSQCHLITCSIEGFPGLNINSFTGIKYAMRPSELQI